MRRILLLVAIVWISFPPSSPSQDRVTAVKADDEAMNQAIADARRHLPHFWATFETRKHGESDFGLKVRIEDENGAEHFWCTDIERADGRISGVIANDPAQVKSVSAGQRITIKEDQISDWLYMRDEKMIGNYTLRVLMRTLAKAERQQLEDMLGPLP